MKLLVNNNRRDSKIEEYCGQQTVSLLDGCGKCVYSLSSGSFINILDDISVKSIVDILMQECKVLSGNKLLLKDTTVTCNGDISIKYSFDYNTNSILSNRRLCFNIINYWLKSKLIEVYKSLNIFYLIICSAILYYDDNEQRASKVLDSLETINTFIYQYLKHELK